MGKPAKKPGATSIPKSFIKSASLPQKPSGPPTRNMFDEAVNEGAYGAKLFHPSQENTPGV